MAWKGGWVILMLFGPSEKGRDGADRLNTLKIFIISFTPQYLISCFGYLFKSSVDDHLAIYSLDIWPLSSKHIYSPDVHIHSFTQPVFIRHVDLPQHLSLVALSACWVPQLRCPSAGIWHFDETDGRNPEDEQVGRRNSGKWPGVKLKQQAFSGCHILWLLPSHMDGCYIFLKAVLCSPNLLQGRDDDKLIIASVFWIFYMMICWR